jgi:hypothetical protein
LRAEASREEGKAKTMKWGVWAYVWALWVLQFAAYEAVGVLTDRGMTLTHFIQLHVPRWLLACLIGWLMYHFLIAPPARRMHL